MDIRTFCTLLGGATTLGIVLGILFALRGVV